MKKKLLVGIMMALVLALGGCGADDTYTIDNKPDSKTEKESKGSKNEQQNSEYAYDFKIDSENKKIYDVKKLPKLDLYKVNINGNLYCHYVMDADGKTIMSPNGEFMKSDFEKYIYCGSNDNFIIYNTLTHNNVNPNAVSEGGIGVVHFVNGDILFTNTGAYDLVTGETLWQTDDSDIYLPHNRTDKLVEYTPYEGEKKKILNYVTGNELTKNITEDYTRIALSGSNHFALEIGEIIKVYDENGKYIGEFNKPEGCKLKPFLLPGDHFLFESEWREWIITDIYGNLLKDKIYSGGSTLKFVSDVVVIQKTGNLNAGVLDKNMNWIIPQEGSEYEYINYWGQQLLLLDKTDGTSYFYNIETGAQMEYESLSDMSVFLDKENQMIENDNKMYSIDDFELIEIDYKDECNYEQITRDTFVEYYVDSSKPVTLYDNEGKVVAKIELEPGEKYYSAAGYSIITYHNENGFELKTFKK